MSEAIAELLAKVAEKCDDAAAVERLTKAIEDLTEVMRAMPPQYVPYPVYPQYPWWQPTIIWGDTSSAATKMPEGYTVTCTNADELVTYIANEFDGHPNVY